MPSGVVDRAGSVFRIGLLADQEENRQGAGWPIFRRGGLRQWIREVLQHVNVRNTVERARWKPGNAQPNRFCWNRIAGSGVVWPLRRKLRLPFEPDHFVEEFGQDDGHPSVARADFAAAGSRRWRGRGSKKAHVLCAHVRSTANAARERLRRAPAAKRRVEACSWSCQEVPCRHLSTNHVQERPRERIYCPGTRSKISIVGLMLRRKLAISGSRLRPTRNPCALRAATATGSAPAW